MKAHSLTISLVSLLLGSSLAFAQAPADEHAGHHPEGTKPPVTVTPQPGKGSESAAMPRMQDNMKKMQDLMARIRASTNPVERQQLLRQHSTAMQDQMKMMRGMSGGPGSMMSGGMNMGGASPPAKTPSSTTKSEGMMNNDMIDHQGMHAQMDMMQLMMEQLLQHQDVQQGAAPLK